jgi:hypothetical protein
MPEDIRKTHVLTTIANYFGIEQNSLSSLSDHRALNSFLDDTNCPLLSATRGQKNSIDLSNEVCLSFYNQFSFLVKKINL